MQSNSGQCVIVDVKWRGDIFTAMPLMFVNAWLEREGIPPLQMIHLKGKSVAIYRPTNGNEHGEDDLQIKFTGGKKFVPNAILRKFDVVIDKTVKKAVA